ncbi:SMI1/KNR4 family protein [uncultured Chryseobacterium sp.]|uniref:SMI1/KNR4 family protein n=1 Tax=uncultured Chryseobacterium sp. TaxID=259322 RepID=UPI0025879364|nr:SMI1/KNR4 family protein [uncultured Chryseobacterium sp.]
MAHLRIDKIKERWKSENIKLNSPATSEFIEVTEEAIDFQFSDDFKKLYLKVDGFADGNWTINMFSVWPLAIILEQYPNENDKSFIPFADYLINSHHIGFVKGKSGVFKNADETLVKIADTFSETIFLIISDADILY